MSATVLLAGCATAPISRPTCPRLAVYSAADQARAAGEYEAAPAGSMVRRMLDDYGLLRAQCRALERALQ